MTLVALLRNKIQCLNDLCCHQEMTWHRKLFLGTSQHIIKAHVLYKQKLLQLSTMALYVVALLTLSAVMPNSAIAQAVTWTQTDINSGSVGSKTYTPGSPGSFSISGSGTGLGYADSSETAVLTPAFGACEIQAQVVSQTNTGNGAIAGLCMRSGVQTSYAAEYVIGTTPANGIFFFRRVQFGGGGNVATTAGAAPLYLKLRRYGDSTNGYSVEGLYSANGINWTSLGSFGEPNTNPMPNKFYAGFVVSSTVSGATQSTAVFDHISYMTSVPQVSANLLLHLRSDVGVTYSSGTVSAWADQSGNGNNASQSNASLRPTITLSSANSGVLPVITLDGSTQYFNLPTDFSNLTAGASAFFVTRHASSSATGTLFSCGNSSNNDALIARTVGTNAALYSFAGSTSSNVTTSSNPLSTSNLQLVEFTLEPGQSAGTATGRVYVNGNLEATATNLQNLANTSRTSNFIGVGDGLSNYFSGDLCEVLVYSTKLSDSQRKSVESYILSKYAIGSAPQLEAPTISPSSGVMVPQQQLVMSQSQDAPVFLTYDGTTPTYDSLFFYTNLPFWLTNASFSMYKPWLSQTTTVKAIAKAPFFSDSPVTTETYTMDTTTTPIPRSGLIQWLRGGNVTLSGSNITNWNDISGSGNNASNGSNQPTLVTGAVNGLAAANFNGSQFLQMPSGYSTFTSGMTAMLVAKPASVSAGARLFELGNGATSDNVILSLPSSTGLTFSTYNGSSGSSATASTGVNLGQFQLLESIYNGSNTATLFQNSSQIATGSSMNTLNNLTRSTNYLGQDSAGSNRFNGQIAEVLLWNRALTLSERTAAEGYLLNKYSLLSTNAVAVPIFSTASATFSEPSQVAIAAVTGAKIYITTDGSTPTTASQEYVKPLFISHSQTIKAIAVLNGVSSSVSNISITLDSTKWPAPSASDTRMLDMKQQLPAVGIPHDASQP